MRILLDDCVNIGLRTALSAHTVKTVSEMGWRNFDDGRLLSSAEEIFDVFITVDQKLKQHYNFKRFRMGFVVLQLPSFAISAYSPLFLQIEEAVRSSTPGKAHYVKAPGHA